MVKLCTLVCVVVCTIQVNAQENRTFDGSRNNLSDLSMGAALTQYSRITDDIVNYSDGIGAINDAHLPNIRNISNTLFNQESSIEDETGLSDFVWAFGQFVCHDIDFVHYNPDEVQMVDVPDDDTFFDQESQLPFFRNKYDESTGSEIGNPRQFLNHVSSYLDASIVYGSDNERAEWLRTFEGGKLKTGPSGNFMPWNTIGGDYNSQIDATAPNMKFIPEISQKFYIAGDERANKSPLLISLHTLFLREHNRLCDELAERHPNWNDERLYQRARKLVGAYIQKITYEDWLPALGIQLEEYNGYDEDIDVSISNEFSAAAIVFENTLIGEEILRLDNSGQPIMSGSMEVGEQFYYDPKGSTATIGIEPYLKGLAAQIQQKFDTKASTSLRNFDFGGEDPIDLVARNIHNGRDRGLMSYNEVRRNIGLPGFTSFLTLTGDTEVADILGSLYDSIEDIDLWVGLLAEKKTSNATMGELIINILEDQFRMLRDGDRFYYENETDVFNAFEIHEIQQTTLRDIILRNSSITLIQNNVFVAAESSPIIELTPIHLNTLIYPNPSVDGNIELVIHSDYFGFADITVVDLLGRALHTESVELRSGSNFTKLSLQNYGVNRGYYNVIVTSKEYSNVTPLVIE